MLEERSVLDIEVRLFLEAVYLAYNYDFRQYSLASVRRRLSSAMIMHKVKTISALQERILHEPEFFTAVLQYLTVSTTEMFRDPSYFKVFREKVVPHLRSYPSLKIWIAGCSTGEEAYSFAILLKEEGLYEKTMIYATDINPLNLEKAKEAIYRVEDVRKFSINYQKSGGKHSLSDYYTSRYEAVALDPALRKNIVFADHSLATDEVFSEMQFISCRNVMIYFERELQDRAIGLFHSSLCPFGFLGIGEKENLKFSLYETHFDVWSLPEKIYRKAK